MVWRVIRPAIQFCARKSAAVAVFAFGASRPQHLPQQSICEKARAIGLAQAF
jgi:hypothetical protein